MKIFLVILTLLLVGCTATEPPFPTGPISVVETVPAADRIQPLVDSLNATIRQMYKENGGKVTDAQLIYPDAIPPDPTLAPIVILFFQKNRTQ